ncbi:MAG: 4Fe-4S binding protein [Oscillibacter sp.]|jgi:electron transport complex protein RnfB|nr:4Fe-4S binding protein [Oscillibacter sp.]MCI9482556.1 4Fe-4S binding protein [Oscillibacter sp.]
MPVTIVLEKCISCGACAVLCPQKAITLQRGGARIDSSRCTGCRLCVNKCYTRAIRVT